MRIILITILFVSSHLCLNGADCPIIFIHGHESKAVPEDDEDKTKGGWKTWYPTEEDGVTLKYPTAMTRIISAHYGNYSAGEPLNCHMNTNLQSTGSESRKVYSFSYYHPGGNPGVISLSEESIRVYFAHVYDVLGSKIDFIATFPPASYDSTGYWSRCVPGVYWDTIDGVPRLRAKDVTRDYVRSWKVGKFAKRLAEFIDKVLLATGASKVDLVCHSMCGLVVRAAMKHYNTSSGEPVKNRIRKLLLIVTPDKGVHYTSAQMIAELLIGHADWQLYGEDLEMNVDPVEQDKDWRL